MSVNARWSVFLVASALAVFVAGPASRMVVLRTAGFALVVSDPLEHADLIVVPQWAGLSGAVEAADLVRQGLANRVVVVGEGRSVAEEELIRRGISYQSTSISIVQVLRSLGVANIEAIASPEGGTTSEGDFLPTWCHVRHYNSVIFVSLPDHSRRVRRVLGRSAKGGASKWMIHPARYASFEADSWWKSRDATRTFVIELQKLLLDITLHPLS